jgi:hypothetical protein
VQWIKLSGSFIADSSYSRLVIGNFFDEIQTDTLIFGGPPFGGSLSYYYIDDVCVTTDSIFNENWLGISENNSEQIKIYPNPSTYLLSIESKKSIEQVSICTVYGEELKGYTYSYNTLRSNISLWEFPNGLYFIKIKTHGKQIIKQILINH